MGLVETIRAAIRLTLLYSIIIRVALSIYAYGPRLWIVLLLFVLLYIGYAAIYTYGSKPRFNQQSDSKIAPQCIPSTNLAHTGLPA